MPMGDENGVAADSAFRMGDTRVLEVLGDALRDYLPAADAAHLLGVLRDELRYTTTGQELRQLHSVTQNCKKCPNLVHSAALPTWNNADPDLYIVAESPSFTKDEGALLTETLKSAGFSSDRCCLSFLNRCKTKEYRAYEPEERENCSRFLLAEIDILRPKLIMTLGLSVAKIFFGEEVRLRDIRGRITWLGPWAIMAVGSPGWVQKSGGDAPAEFSGDFIAAHHYLYGDTNK